MKNTNFSESQLLVVLQISHMWDAQKTADWAIQGLSEQGLAATRLLEISLQYGVKTWVLSACTSIMTFSSTRDLTKTDQFRLGDELYFIFVHALTRRNDAITLMFSVPQGLKEKVQGSEGLQDVRLAGCLKDHEQARVLGWHVFWKKHFSKKILSPLPNSQLWLSDFC